MESVTLESDQVQTPGTPVQRDGRPYIVEKCEPSGTGFRLICRSVQPQELEALVRCVLRRAEKNS